MGRKPKDKMTENGENGTKDNSNLPQKDLFRIDEVAEYFGVVENTIRLWIAHGHLEKEKIVGSVRITRESILKCRFKGKSIISEPQL